MFSVAEGHVHFFMFFIMNSENYSFLSTNEIGSEVFAPGSRRLPYVLYMHRCTQQVLIFNLRIDRNDRNRVISKSVSSHSEDQQHRSLSRRPLIKSINTKIRRIIMDHQGNCWQVFEAHHSMLHAPKIMVKSYRCLLNQSTFPLEREPFALSIPSRVMASFVGLPSTVSISISGFVY